MAGIDYSIPGQIKSIQVESPINAMAQAMQLRNMQDAMEMNALKKQEYGRAREEENAARKWFASGKKLDSPEALNELYSLAPGLAPTIEKNMLERGKTTAEISYKGSQKLKEDAETLDKELKNFNSFFSPLSVTSPELAEARTRAIYKNPTLKQWASRFMDEETAAKQSYNLFKTNRENWLDSQLSLDGKTIVEVTASREKQLRDRAEKAYPAYQLSEYEAGREPLTIDEYVAQRMQTTAAPTTTASTTTAPTTTALKPEFVGEGGAITKLPDGSVNLPPVTKSADKMPSAFGTDVHPLVPSLIAGGNVEAAKLVQEAYKTTGTFRQIQDTLRELDRLEKDKPKGWEARVKVLRDYLKTASTEGPGAKLSIGNITLSTEKSYGGKFAGNIADKDAALLDAAERAPEAANTANRVLGLLSSGQVITGAGANIKLQLAKWLRVAGGSENETVANTEILLSSLADTTLGSIKSSGLGSGQGFTNSDRDFLERAKAGQITYDAASLRRLAELAHRAAEATTDKWNKRSKAIPKSAIEGTGISTEDIKVSPLYKSGGSNKTPLKNAQGWVLSEDKKGNKAYVSPDGKQFEEVK
jgi:hypothetical protein